MRCWGPVVTKIRVCAKKEEEKKKEWKIRLDDMEFESPENAGLYIIVCTGVGSRT